MAKFFEMHGSVMATYEAAGRRFGISAKACKERWHRRGDGLKFSHGKGAAGKENVQPEASGSGTTSLAASFVPATTTSSTASVLGAVQPHTLHV